MGAERTLFLHVGTHKTGTTSIQELIALNEARLDEMGVYVPRAGRPWGRPDILGVGHHNVAWELLGHGSFAPQGGTFAELLEEIAARQAPSALLSSEELQYLHARPDVLRSVAARAADYGYGVTVVLYLRQQADYIQSIYSQAAKSGLAADFAEFVARAIGLGSYGTAPVVLRFVYSELADPFALAFGRTRLILRFYRSTDDTSTLLRDFVETLGPGVSFDDLELPEALNVSPSIMHVLNGMYATVREREPSAPDPQQLVRQYFQSRDVLTFMEKLDAMLESEVAAALERFSPDNRRVEAAYGLRIPFTDPTDLVPFGARRSEIVRKHRRLLALAARRWGIGGDG
ncbi:MAG TPA: hypothetical protein VMH02_08135 [Verrucomicrobiae bacterium]|nr:hypothetical protein [Verrucomicrobiae bacterium]